MMVTRGVVLTPRSINSTSTNIHQHPCALQPAPPPPSSPCHVRAAMHLLAPPRLPHPGYVPGRHRHRHIRQLRVGKPGGRGGAGTRQGRVHHVAVAVLPHLGVQVVLLDLQGCVCVCGQQRGCVGVWVLEEQEGTWGWERWLAQQVVTQLSEWVCTSAQRVV